MMARLFRWLFPEQEKAKNGSERTVAALDELNRAMREEDEGRLQTLIKALRREEGVDR